MFEVNIFPNDFYLMNLSANLPFIIFLPFLDATVLRNAIHVQYPGCQGGKGQI